MQRIFRIFFLLGCVLVFDEIGKVLPGAESI